MEIKNEKYKTRSVYIIILSHSRWRRMKEKNVCSQFREMKAFTLNCCRFSVKKPKYISAIAKTELIAYFLCFEFRILETSYRRIPRV